MSRRARVFLNESHIGPRHLEHCDDPGTVLADLTGVEHRRTSPRQRNGLVVPFASGEAGQGEAGECLPGLDNVGNPVNQVDIDGTEIEDFHQDTFTELKPIMPFSKTNPAPPRPSFPSTPSSTFLPSQ